MGILFLVMHMVSEWNPYYKNNSNYNMLIIDIKILYIDKSVLIH